MCFFWVVFQCLLLVLTNRVFLILLAGGLDDGLALLHIPNPYVILILRCQTTSAFSLRGECTGRQLVR
jgi:hypothetical protein